MPFDRKLARAESFSLGPSPLVNQFLSDKAQDSPVVKPPLRVACNMLHVAGWKEAGS